MEVCRFCKHYQPDMRYKGMLGICKQSNDAMGAKDTCECFERGPQEWLQGGKAE